VWGMVGGDPIRRSQPRLPGSFGTPASRGGCTGHSLIRPGSSAARRPARRCWPAPGPHRLRQEPRPAPPPGLAARAYDTAGRRAAVSLNGVVQATYTYDWKGQQAVRRFPASGLAIQSVFDSAGHRIAEYSEGTGALIRAYVWLGDMPVAVVEGGQIYSVRVDHIGRPAFATTSAGTVVWSASYLPFGGVNVSTGAPSTCASPASGSRPRRGFTRTGCATTIRRQGGISRPTRWG
jgi:uncharacterized protein RhaS with RHS repeats